MKAGTQETAARRQSAVATVIAALLSRGVGSFSFPAFLIHSPDIRFLGSWFPD
jgi:hypothetical protein